ncbi:Hypothetical protein FKW44_023270, partial [Caligus rogercresseyi]
KESIREKWIEFCGSPKLAKYPRICDRHFEEQVVIRSESRNGARQGCRPEPQRGQDRYALPAQAF